jgi:excisionase family DNA binding protein
MSAIATYSQGEPMPTTDDVALLLGVSHRTVYRLADRGVLERVKIGHRTVRYTPRSVRALVEPPTNENGPAANRSVQEGDRGSGQHTE